MGQQDPIQFARNLRRTATSSEAMLWQLLRNGGRTGKKFRRQHPIGLYTADFFCAEAKLVIEIDGAPHETDEGRQKDAQRDAWMRAQGLEVMRFGGWQVERETEQVVARIEQALKVRCVK